MSEREKKPPHRTIPSILGLAALAGVTACATAGGGVAGVSPQEIPELEARVAQEPQNGDLLLRYAAALFSANNCDSASSVAARGAQLSPRNAVAPLVIGPCLEQSGRYEDAIATYVRFAAEHPDSRGLPAVRARELIARRAGATQSAREALAREDELAGQTPDPQVVAVLPVAIAGDSTYEPLSRGLAQMMMSDLSLLRTFRMVERLQIGALLDELQLNQSDQVDPQTAARVGHLVSAGRMVQGLAVIPDQADVRLEGGVVQSTGEVTTPHVVQGTFRNLLQMEKELVVVLAVQLGYRLSEAERQLILENGTQNIAAFLAYSRGLEAEELGDYGSAAAFYGQAVQSDPNFREARSRQQSASTAQQVQQSPPGQVTTLAAESPAASGPAEAPVSSPVIGAVQGALGDLASTHTEQTTESANESVNVVTRTSSSSTASEPPPPDLTPQNITTTIRIIFRLP